MDLDEIVVSVLADEQGGYRNLHVGVSAIINPRKVSVYNPYDVRSLVKRLGPRLESKLVASILEFGRVGVGDLRLVRERLDGDAQSVIDDALSGWEHSDEYEIDVVIGSLYFTDGSVGRRNDPRPAWW